MNRYIRIITLMITFLLFITSCSSGARTSAIIGKSINELLYVALDTGNLEYVKECINSGANIDKVRDGGLMSKEYSTLSIAITNADYRLFEYLVVQGADVNYSNDKGISLLMMFSNSSITGEKRFLDLMFEKGVDINHTDNEGYTALDYAVRNGSIESVLLFLEKGAQVSTNTYKMLMEYNNNRGNADYNLIKAIFEADINQAVETGISPIVAKSIIGDSEYIVSSIKKDLVDEDIINSILCYVVAFCNTDALEAIIDLGADVYSSDINNHSLLWVAAYNGNLDNFIYLEENGLSIQNDRDSDKLLLTAIQNNKYNIVKYLFQQGESLTLKDNADNYPWVTFNNPIDNVIKNGNIEMIKLLVNYGYPITNETVSYAAQKAIEFHQTEVLNYFLNKGLDINDIDKNLGRTLLEASCQFDDIEVAKLLIEKGADENGFGASVPLISAVQSGNVEMVKLLIDNGADVNRVRSYDDSSKSQPALMMATQKGYLDIIKLFVENKVDLEHQYWNSKETVVLATSDTSSNILQYFIDSGANINCQNREGETPLMRAVSAGNIKNVEILTNADADIELQNINGISALDIAKKANYKEIYKLLKLAEQ